jgi:hypothetical protein
MPHKDPEERKKYHREYLRRKYTEDASYRAKHRSRTRKNDSKYKAQRDMLIAEFRQHGCLLCPEKEPVCLSAHHLNPEEKDFSISSALTNKLSAVKIAKELKKCICVCENCHRKIHAGLLGSTPSPASSLWGVLD